MESKLRIKCEHPNCRVLACKNHPKNKDKWLCENHYIEVLETIKSRNTIISLTATEDTTPTNQKV